jgi:hypothetical protein
MAFTISGEMSNEEPPDYCHSVGVKYPGICPVLTLKRRLGIVIPRLSNFVKALHLEFATLHPNRFCAKILGV